jgi:16S rRNA (uracil1498-N3)-methyltransferase
VERIDRPAVATFFAHDPFAVGGSITLGEDAAHHMRVLRIDSGQRVALVDGAGHIGGGTLVRLARNHAVVDVDEARLVDPLPELHLMVPVADRERMLLLAEKATELGASSWRPVLWRRSRSVSPRGEGAAFQSKVRGRMMAALSQCDGAWLPMIYPDATVDRAIAATPPDGTRLLLDPDGAPLLELLGSTPVTVAVGPEGGIEREERAQLVAAGFALARLGGNILRFETAAIAALSIARAALVSPMEHGV